MAIEQDTITLPAAWAAALTNGDYTGFDFSDADGGEALRCSTAEDELTADGWSIVATESEPYFTWFYRRYDAGSAYSGGNVRDYAIVRRKG